MSTERSAPAYSAVHSRALKSVAVQFFVNGALFASFVPRLPEIRDRIEVSVSTIGVLLSLAGLSGLLGSAAVGHVIGRFGTRRVMLSASAVVSGCLAVVGLARSPALFVVGLMGMIAFDVLVDVAMNMQGSWLSALRHTPVLNRLHGLWSLGTLVGGAVSSRMAAAGVSLTAHLLGAAAVLLLVLAYVGPGLLADDLSPESETAPANDRDPPPLRPVSVGKLVLFGFFAAGFFGVTLELTAIDWAAFRLSDDFALSAGSAAIGYVAVTAGMTVSRFVADSVVARLGTMTTTWISLGLTATGMLIANLSASSSLSLLGFALNGAGIAALLPAMYDTAAKLPGRAALGLGALTAGLRTAALSVPGVVGLLAGTGLSVGQAVVVVALPSVVGFGVAVSRMGVFR